MKTIKRQNNMGRRIMKAIKIILGIGTILLSLAMMIFSWYFFFEEENAILCLASLYVCLFVSALIFSLGMSIIPKRRKKDESNDD